MLLEQQPHELRLHVGSKGEGLLQVREPAVDKADSQPKMQ
jgi:hypothetical protein